MLADLLRELDAAGVQIELEGERLAVPSGVLTDAMREEIKAHRHDLIDLLRRSEQITEQLIQAAMRACDAFGDGPAAREQMRQDCLNLPHHQRAEALKHFKNEYRSDQR